MRQALGMILIVASAWLLVLGFVWFSTFINDPGIFPLYQSLAEMPEEDRTLMTEQGDMILPVGIFKISGLFFVVLLLFLALGIIKMFFMAGITLLAPKAEDVMDKLLKRLKQSRPSDAGCWSCGAG